MGTPSYDGFMCIEHAIEYKGKCLSCEFEKNMPLSYLLGVFKAGQIAKATYARTEHWYIKKSNWGAIYYCDENGENYGELVPMTPSNLNATYEIVR